MEKGATAGVVILTGVASVINPALGVAFGMAAALFGPAIERRQERARQLMEFIDNKINSIPNDIFENKTFQDGFVFLLEKYIRERNDDKRLILQQILLGYINAPNLLDYPLEEMTDLISRIRMADVAVFRSALEEEGRQDLGQDGTRASFMLRENPNAVSRLIYFGLLHEDRSKSGPHVREHDDKNFLYVWVSPAGREFCRYLGASS